MPVIDMNVNPVATAAEEGLTLIGAERLSAYAAEGVKVLDTCGIERAALVVLGDAAIDDSAADQSMRRIASEGRFSVAMAVDFRRADAVRRLERARSLGITGLKFHPYLQRIEHAEHAAALTLARVADALGMYVMVCCSYGTRLLDRHSGLRLAAAVAGEVVCPVVMSHAGGRQVLDAMLIAEDARNVYLDTSFSLHYYKGSTVELDFAFAMRKLGAHRWVYGSDAPFVPAGESLSETAAFLDRHGFGAADVEAIMYDTASAILGQAHA